MTYAWYMHLDHETRDRLHRLGCTASGWIHAGGGPPWTVLVADTVDEAHAGPGFFDSIMEQAKVMVIPPPKNTSGTPY